MSTSARASLLVGLAAAIPTQAPLGLAIFAIPIRTLTLLQLIGSLPPGMQKVFVGMTTAHLLFVGISSLKAIIILA